MASLLFWKAMFAWARAWVTLFLLPFAVFALILFAFMGYGFWKDALLIASLLFGTILMLGIALITTNPKYEGSVFYVTPREYRREMEKESFRKLRESSEKVLADTIEMCAQITQECGPRAQIRYVVQFARYLKARYG